MPWSKHTWMDQQIDAIIGNLLRVRVVLSALVAVFGGTLYLVRRRSAFPEYCCPPEHYDVGDFHSRAKTRPQNLFEIAAITNHHTCQYSDSCVAGSRSVSHPKSSFLFKTRREN
jgi:hypothetical protein